MASSLLGVVVLVGCQRPPQPAALEAGRMGSVRVFRNPAGPPSSFVYVFSPVGGWNPALDREAAALAESGAVVVGVDLPQYLAGLAASDDGCHYLLSEIEDLSQRLQRQFGTRGYRSPILAGVGAGGTLAYAALTQSPAATVAGAISVDPTPGLATKVPLCPGAPAEKSSDGFRYGSVASLPGWWELDTPASDDGFRRIATMPQATLRERDGDPIRRLRLDIEEKIAATAEAAGLAAELPLVELPSDHTAGLMAIIYSGDGGWRDLDMQIGDALSEWGVPVVGIDSLRYFWSEKSPEQTAADLSRVVREYTTEWKSPQVIVVGYSFGAGILPFAYNRMAADLRPSIVQISLLGLEARAAFEIEVSGWLGAAPGSENPEVLPEIQRIDPAMVQCFFGEDEEETLCRDPGLAATEIVRTEGGHHFDGDYPGLAKRILEGARRRAGRVTAAGRTPMPERSPVGP